MVKCYFLVKTQIKSIEKMVFSTPLEDKTVSPIFFKKWFFKIQSGGELCMNFSYKIKSKMERKKNFLEKKISPFHFSYHPNGPKVHIVPHQTFTRSDNHPNI